jgi:hypothetical protein
VGSDLKNCEQRPVISLFPLVWYSVMAIVRDMVGSEMGLEMLNSRGLYLPIPSTRYSIGT